MNVGGFVSGLKQKARDRAEKREKNLELEYGRLEKESKLLKKKAEVYSSRVQMRKNVSDLKREVRVAKIQNNPLGLVALNVASRIKENQKKSDKKDKMNFLPSGKDHPMFRK